MQTTFRVMAEIASILIPIGNQSSAVDCREAE